MQHRMMKRAAFIFAPFAAMILTSGPLRAETRLAVIAVPQSGADDLGDLVQLRLGERKDLALVERAAIKDILREQELQSVMAADAPGKRAALGRLLKADTLVLLAGRQKPQPHVELVICETQRGLRLASDPLTRSGNLETDAAAVIKRVEDAIARQQQKIREIVAVPPLLNRTLTREMDHLQGAYARLIEQSLLQRPGVLVVELSEAKAVAQEIFVSSTPGIERRLPLYLVGEFRVEGAGEKRRGQFTWKLLRGESELESRTVADLKVDDLPGRLQQAAQEMLDKALGQSAKPPDAAAEVRQLTQRAAVFASIGNWPETVALAEAGLLLAPDNVELHGHAFLALNKMAGELPLFARKTSRGDVLGALAYMRAALPHMEPYLRGTKLDSRHDWCTRPWNRLSLELKSPMVGLLPSAFDLEHRRLCVELWKELMPVARRVLAAKAAARVRDGSLYFLAPWTEPPQYVLRPPWAVPLQYDRAHLSGDRRFDNEYSFGSDGEVSTICKQRLKLLAEFAELTDPKIVYLNVPYLVRPPWGRSDEPAYQEFLSSVEKLPNEGMRELARAAREGGRRRPYWIPEPPKGAPPKAKPRATAVPNAEVAFHPVQLTVVDPDGKEYPFPGRHAVQLISWIKTAEGIDAVLGHGYGYVQGEKGRPEYSPRDILYLMKEKGRLVRLPLEIHPSAPLDPSRASGMNLCWDGRFLWVVSPAPWVNASDGWAAPKRFLAAIDPKTAQIVKLTGADGLPPMNHPWGGAPSSAVTALGPGRVLVAGHFGRSWCGVASLGAEKKIALDVFFEATEVYDEWKRQESVAKTVAFPIRFLCTLNRPAGAGEAAGQRVLLGRVGRDRPPLLIDPEKRSVEVLSEPMWPEGDLSHAYSVHDGSFYWYGYDCRRRFGIHRIGFPDFRQEQVHTGAITGISGPFVVCDNRVYAWQMGQLCMAASFPETFAVLPGNTPVTTYGAHPNHLGLSHHFGMVGWNEGSNLNLRSIEVRFH